MRDTIFGLMILMFSLMLLPALALASAGPVGQVSQLHVVFLSAQASNA
jgi:hypothetical protein